MERGNGGDLLAASYQPSVDVLLGYNVRGNVSGMSNATDLLSESQMLDIYKQTMSARRFDYVTEMCLIVAFATLILFGASGNGLVCYVVAKNPHMRTPRNIFIINLAISDFTLCVFTQPFNLMKLLTLDWPFGNFMCKFVPMFQGTNVFVSTISITAIALDRFQVIVYPTKDSMKKIGAAAALISIWVISFLIASPTLVFTYYKSERPLQELPFYQYRCIEDDTLNIERGAYSIACVVVQYFLPIIIVSVAHARICNKLRYRMVNQPSPAGAPSPYRQKKNERETRRKRRTNILLAMIGIVFALSWLPLNICNILTELHRKFFSDYNVNISLTFVICHLLVLISACANPVLYGWLNENFRTEFVKVLCCSCCKTLHESASHNCCAKRGHQNVPVIVLSKESNGYTIHDRQTGLTGQITSTMMPSSSDFV